MKLELTAKELQQRKIEAIAKYNISKNDYELIQSNLNKFEILSKLNLSNSPYYSSDKICILANNIEENSKKQRELGDDISILRKLQNISIEEYNNLLARFKQ